MLKINYKEPEELETVDDIAIFNIKICDKYKKADYLELSCISWLKNDSNRNYQDLEQLFRHLDLDSYIIAQTIETIPSGFKISMHNQPIQTNNSISFEYLAKITCMEKNDSMKELLKYHLTWEENFKYLEKTGCLIAIEQEINKEKVSQINNDDNIKKLLECKLKLNLEYYSVEESINFIIKDLADKYGKTPEKNVCGKIGINNVWALMLNGQIISPIGWIEKLPNSTDNEINYELIDFRKIKIEK